MSIRRAKRQGESAIPRQANGVRLVKPLQFNDRSPQTTGMLRLEAVSHGLVGSEGLWAGVMLADPETASSVHHHGPLETVIYVISGQSKVRWGSRLEHEVDLEPGDFVFIPPFVPHQEINPSHDQPTEWVVVRSGGEAIVVPLTKAFNGEYVAEGAKSNALLAAEDGELLAEGAMASGAKSQTS